VLACHQATKPTILGVGGSRSEQDLPDQRDGQQSPHPPLKLRCMREGSESHSGRVRTGYITGGDIQGFKNRLQLYSTVCWGDVTRWESSIACCQLNRVPR